jgi:hypothetical protein
MTAEKQAICVWDSFEKIRRFTDASKSGIDKAILGMVETSEEETGMTAPPVMGTLAFKGHRLLTLELLDMQMEAQTWQSLHYTG